LKGDLSVGLSAVL
jgi:hypothetical protein